MVQKVWYRRWKFSILLGTLLWLFIVQPLFQDLQETHRLIYYPMVALVFLAACLVLFQRRQSRMLAIVFGIPIVIGGLAARLIPNVSPSVSTVVFHSYAAVFFGHTVVTILQTIFRERDVSADSINGAFCGYLLIGLAFGHLYFVVETLVPSSFHLEAHVGTLSTDSSLRHGLLTYFSIITLTTVGFGDICPQSGPARSLACVEAVVGQFYVAVIIAELIAMKVSASFENRQQDEQSERESTRPPS